MLRGGKKHREGLRIARLLMVLSSFAPLFVLMGIRGNSVIPELYFLTTCLALAILPTLFLVWRIHTVRRVKDIKQLKAGKSEDNRSHILGYLFATLLPFYQEDIGTYRDLAAMLVALGFIVFLFWSLRLHYLNLCFAICGFHIFTVSTPCEGNSYSGLESFVLITRQKRLREGDQITAFRLSNTVYLEKNNDS